MFLICDTLQIANLTVIIKPLCSFVHAMDQNNSHRTSSNQSMGRKVHVIVIMAMILNVVTHFNDFFSFI